MQRIEHIKRMNKIKAYGTFMRQLREYIKKYHSIEWVSQKAGIPQDILEDSLDGQRELSFLNFTAIMEALGIKVHRNKVFDYEV